MYFELRIYMLIMNDLIKKTIFMIKNVIENAKRIKTIIINLIIILFCDLQSNVQVQLMITFFLKTFFFKLQILHHCYNLINFYFNSRHLI